MSHEPEEQHRKRDRLDRIFEELAGSGDIVIQTLEVGKEEPKRGFRILMCSGMVDMQTVFIALLPQLDKLAENINKNFGKFDQTEAVHEPVVMDKNHLHKEGCSFGARLSLDDEREVAFFFSNLYSGSVIVIDEATRSVYSFDIASIPGRQPEESTMELSVKGPRDGFVEGITTNIALIRRRLRTPDLNVEYMKIGTESQTEISIMFMRSKAEPSLVREAKKRLDAIHIEALYSSSELEELVSDRPNSLFPLVDYIGRPDYVVQSLMQGRVCLLVDGNPSVIILPGNLTLLVKSPEDAHLPYYYVTLERLLRFTGFVLAICLPGFWVALSAYNTDQIPFTLLATVTNSRIGLPISATMEMFLMMAMFELFREAGVRLPRPVGQTVSVVGGLIIGDAAIRAGITSPTMLVAAAITAVSTFTLVNQTLSGTVSILRFFVLILSSMFGIFGFFVGVFLILIYMCSLETFNQNYMQPIAPIKWRELVTGLFQKPWKSRAKGEKP
ncbi:spore germination protein [Paenibacillus sp. JDR-2]|uniref:spore germination protein n=1 Tax=Paenibacillus sp. (strain JDR-2) TaxID=324057 RepID=UPI000166A696|nr:spore germination protein [Paenibacillus sp. JDR-2]ACT00074.1 GerA spore germination protein [Paenibacillus sp. JDR-2]